MNATKQLSRRRWLGLAGSAALAAPAVLPRPARAADFSFKLATTIPVGHPLNSRAEEAAKAIARESGGRLQIEVFPGYVLGSSSSALGQLREGSLELVTLSGSVLSTLVPVSTIYNTAYAFQNYEQVWQAMDGPLGDFLREKIAAAGLHAFSKHWDLGFREVTSGFKPVAKPDDLHGMKIRVPVAPLFLSCFKALGAAPTPINFDELYSALQTRIVDGQENDLINIEAGKLYEVQKFCSMTGHIWDGYFTLANGTIFQSLPPDLRAILERNINGAALAEREDVRKQTDAIRQQLEKKMTFVEPDRAAFRAALKKAGFYTELRTKFGDEAWRLLEATVGPLT